ncbi:Aminotransferase [Trypanosoma melophagium]|uniref:Aminotransferase n=1 Tax=Trypanosoma melophagium TaxID=715481 RepID=UPI003519FB24|nr:Aminotransferase [Trypanosoma melophagium]
MHKTLGNIGKNVAATAAGTFNNIGNVNGSDATSSLGVFQNVHIKPFPVRAAIDIGTGGMASLTVGRVDAAQNAVRDFMYQTQVPLYLQSATSTTASNSSSSSSFVMSEETRVDIRNKMRLLHGALRRDNYDGLSERAAVISWPLCEAADAVSLAEELAREFKIDVRVLGKTFNMKMPFLDSAETSNSMHAVNPSREEKSLHSVRYNRETSGDDSLQLLIQRVARRRDRRRHSSQAVDTEDEISCVVSPKQQLEQLAFLAHAAVSKCIAPQRMLVLVEDSHRGLCILGTDTTEVKECTEFNEINSKGDIVVSSEVKNSSSVLLHMLPVDTEVAHRLLLTVVQRRDGACGDSGGRRSPNPVLREEFQQLRHLLEEMVCPTLPEWVLQKSRTGGVICGSSFNGGVLNIAARVSQRTSVSLDHLETNALMHYCGLTDVLLAENYADPTIVLPNAAVASALMRALETRRFEYLPEVNVAAALLIQPSLWTYGRRERIRESLETNSFYSGGSGRRTFRRPHSRVNPTSSPEAAWQRNQSWNPLSYENSTKGT